MKDYVLNYYPKFKCLAEKCKHTCCAGWEMNIDKRTLDAYKSDTSKFSASLKKGVNFKKSCFKSNKVGRCAFLNSDGLCEIIINLGENSLCQVCRDHPRFRSFFLDRVEMGLGFCCEQATKIILSFDDKIEPMLMGDNGEHIELDFNQKNVIEFRQKALEILQDRKISINNRIESLLKLSNANVLEKDYNKILKKFLTFERLDKNWTKRLKGIRKKPFNISIDESLSLYCEQFLVNELYRHLSDAEDTLWVRARAIASVFSWWIIKTIIENEKESDCFSTIVDVVRAYSAEVEYSQKNLDKLFFFAYKFIKI
ncbi:MAG: flagellin lysine-N-methylase [Clostridia bacterium]|nr:flagellin lysine-N-methylase [Clostridia bacterium]